MDEFLRLFGRHGYSLLALLVFAEAIGLPVPAALALLAAGTACAWHVMNPLAAVAVAIGAMLWGDWLMYLVGRHSGWALLGFLCRVSMNPETCILRSAESFYRRGKKTLVFAKFVPGINTMAPPLAGSMRMKSRTFLWFDFLGTSLYVLSYGLAGFLFSDFVRSITRGLVAASRAVEIMLALAVLAYLAYRVWDYRKHRAARDVPRVTVEELARHLESEGKDEILVVDVRSHGYYDEETQRIKGSIRIEPNHLDEEVKLLPSDKLIFLYCT
jgi:membrane protein DedA with SNARE-associated domain